MEAKKMGPPRQQRDMEGLLHEILADRAIHESGTDRWRSTCPFCESPNVEVFVTFRNGRFKCFRCHEEGDIVRLVVKTRGMSYVAAKELVSAAPRLVPKLITSLKLKEKGLPYPVFPESEISPYRGSCPSYLLGRGFQQQTLRTYHVGYDHHQVRIVIPARDFAGRLVGITYRLDFDEPGRPKYWHDNWNSSQHLYGFHLWAGKRIPKLFIVEGQLDAQRLYQLGYPAVAVMGSHIYDEQIRLLNDYLDADHIVLASDNDEAGADLRRQAISVLTRTRFCKGLQVASFPGKDPGELKHASQVTTRPWYVGLLSPPGTVNGAPPHAKGLAQCRESHVVPRLSNRWPSSAKRSSREATPGTFRWRSGRRASSSASGETSSTGSIPSLA